MDERKWWCRIGYVILTNEKNGLICSVCEWRKVGGCKLLGERRSW